MRKKHGKSPCAKLKNKYLRREERKQKWSKGAKCEVRKNFPDGEEEDKEEFCKVVSLESKDA